MAQNVLILIAKQFMTLQKGLEIYVKTRQIEGIIAWLESQVCQLARLPVEMDNVIFFDSPAGRIVITENVLEDSSFTSISIGLGEGPWSNDVIR